MYDHDTTVVCDLSSLTRDADAGSAVVSKKCRKFVAPGPTSGLPPVRSDAARVVVTPAVWVEMPSFLDLKSILAEAVERGVTYVPGDAFYPDGRGRNCMRLAFCYVEPEKIREGIARLAEVLEDRLELYRAFAAAGVLPAAAAEGRG